LTPSEAASRSRLAEASLVLITIIWGTTFPLLRTSLRILDPYDIVALRFTIAAVLIAAIFWKRFRYWNRTALWDGALTGFFMGTGYLVQAIGLTTISSPRSAFITGTAVIFVPFIDRFVSKLGATLGEIVAVALTFVGLLLFYADANLKLKAGDLWTLLGAVMFASQVVTTNVAARRSDPFVVSALQSAAAAMVAWVFIIPRGGLSVPWRAIPWDRILYSGSSRPR